MIIVTGAAGFIGGNLVRALNQRGRRDIIAVDDAEDADKARALRELEVADCMSKRELLDAMRADKCGEVRAVLHQGACADTMQSDADYMLENNLAYSQAVYEFCRKRGAQLLYASSASVYGGGEVFVEDRANESALNIYAKSKLLFDNFVREQSVDNQVVGLRYFNVYGPGEQHKGRMASVMLHFYRQAAAGESVKLFKGGKDCADGEQRRDFVAIDDVVAVNLFFLEHPELSGIFNLGCGASRSFNEVALRVINAHREMQGERGLSLDAARAEGLIEYIDMPRALRGKYQNYTQADIGKLRAAGYTARMLDLEQGVARYLASLASR